MPPFFKTALMTAIIATVPFLSLHAEETAPMSTPPELTKMQEYVIWHSGTEKPFENEYWDHKEAGIYVDRVSGEALFSSTDKFDSGTGWPSFTKPISDHGITTQIDRSHGMTRMEVKSSASKAHLGHVFDDGPKDKGGLRFCVNSASLRFIPLADMEAQGYGAYLPLFAQAD